MTQINTASARETFSIIAKEIADRKVAQVRPKATTYGIAQRTKTSAIVRTDLPVFKTVAEADTYIACELFDFDYAMFYITPLEVN